MRNRYEKQLQQLNCELIEMGSLIEKAISGAVTALMKQNKEEIKQVRELEQEVNQKEKEIESLCLKLLLQQQPVAKDLRQISSALKMITDMERIGDQAEDIAELAGMLGGTSYLEKLHHIPEMAKATIKMVTSSIDAFVNSDVELAYAVIKQDDVVDHLFTAVKAALIDLIRESVDNSEQAADLLMVAKYFERIGDHATNIAEWVIFAITGTHDHQTITNS